MKYLPDFKFTPFEEALEQSVKWFIEVYFSSINLIQSYSQYNRRITILHGLVCQRALWVVDLSVGGAFGSQNIESFVPFKLYCINWHQFPSFDSTRQVKLEYR